LDYVNKEKEENLLIKN